MKVFDQAKASMVVTREVGSSILTFCSTDCRIDRINGMPCVRSRSMYGCWRCGEDMLQGLNLDRPMDDDNLWRQRREQS